MEKPIVVNAYSWTGLNPYQDLLFLGMPFSWFRWWFSAFPNWYCPFFYARYGYNELWDGFGWSWEIFTRASARVAEGEIRSVFWGHSYVRPAYDPR